jgi:hypothetical protein
LTERRIFSCHKSEAFNPVRTKPLVRAEIADFIGVLLSGGAEHSGSTGSFAGPLRRSKWRTAHTIKGILQPLRRLAAKIGAKSTALAWRIRWS